MYNVSKKIRKSIGDLSVKSDAWGSALVNVFQQWGGGGGGVRAYPGAIDIFENLFVNIPLSRAA
jgi:hypothetical protein